MRIHSDMLHYDHIMAAFRAERDANRIASHVTLSVSEHGSRSHTRAFEVRMEAAQRDRGRRAGNTGSYGSMDPRDGYAATYDEWGWLLSALYRVDGEMLCGTPGNPVYVDRVHFNTRTGYTYDLDWDWADGDPYPYRQGHRRIGRRGAGRTDTSRWGGKLDERTPEWMAAFRAGEVF